MNRLQLGFAAAGLILAVLSVASDDRRLGWAAIAFLTASLILRIVLGKRRSKDVDRDTPV
jgi:hypothetical protein